MQCTYNGLDTNKSAFLIIVIDKCLVTVCLANHSLVFIFVGIFVSRIRYSIRPGSSNVVVAMQELRSITTFLLYSSLGFM